MLVNMKEPVELEPMKKIDEIRRFSNKELRLSKEPMGALPKFKEYCGPIRTKSYSYVSGTIGIRYNPFINEDIRDCFFDYEQAVLLRFWTSRFATIRSATNQEKQHKQLMILFENIVMKAKTETELTAGCHGETEVNLTTALGFYSMFGSLKSLLNPEHKHEMVTAISVEVFPGVLQTEQKHIGKWREAIEAEMNIRHCETYRRPSGARYLVGSTLTPMCKSRYPVHFVAVDVKSTKTIVDPAVSVPKCVRIARMSEKYYELLCKMLSAVPKNTKEELISILGKKFMGYASGNFSDFERQKQRGSTVTDYNAVDENDEVRRVMMEVEPLQEASGKRNWRSILSTHDEFLCHCLLQAWPYPGRSNLVLIWDCGELLSMGLPDSSQPITIVIVGVMMAIRWLEAHVKENNR